MPNVLNNRFPKLLDTKIGFAVDIGKILGVKMVPSEARQRLAQHMSILQSFGYTDLAALGELKVGLNGKPVTVIQKSGVLYPKPRLFQDASEQLSGIAMRSSTRGAFAGISGAALVANTEQPPSSANAKVVPLDVAYWYATEIILTDDTTVVLAANVKALVIIAQKLTIGKNVSISWEHLPATAALIPTKPGTPADYPQASSVGSERGLDGASGYVGAQGTSGQPAPELELWFLESTGFPAIDMRGQDGFPGGRGGDGGDGGSGQKGCNTEKKKFFCSQEQGGGGDGGTGGRAGDGGIGGMGGKGGRFSVFAPQPIINSWLQSGLTISVDGGNFGAGGEAGRPGEGGPGGEKGDRQHDVCPTNSREPGVKGGSGPSGTRGADGKKGVMQPASIQFAPISTADFNIELTKPAIVSFAPQTAYVGDTVSVNGLRFVPDDQVLIEGFDGKITVPCETTFISETLLTFKVPLVPGGYAFCEVVQSDGTHSANRGTLLIRPKIDAIVPAGKVRPGEYYFLKGSGFGRSGNIWINGEETGTFDLVDNNTIKFKARRPSNAENNSSGERVKLKVVNAEGTGQSNPNHSPEIDVVLDTYRVLVFGDSVMWGGGLPEHQKYYSLATAYVASKLNNVGVYKTIKAHHGAKIGMGDSTIKDELPGELSSRYPTITQQVDSLSSISDAADIDLVLLDGGANDIPITDVMLKTSPSQVAAKTTELISSTHQYCFNDMVTLLQKVVAQYPRAIVIVTGYFHIFSAESNLSNLSAMYLALCDGELLPLDSPAATAQKLTTLCDVWVTESNQNLLAAVTSINNSLSSEPRVFFVNPETTPRNAAHAPESLLWEPDTLGGPQDPLWATVREKQREDNKARLESEPATWGNGYKISKRNSSYHPNPAGAQRYFDKMRPVLDLATNAKRIGLRAKSGHYLCAELGGNSTLVANRTNLGPWETFELIDLGNTKVALKSVNGFYVSADNSGVLSVTVTQQRIVPSAIFTLVPQALGFAFKTSDDHYLSATLGGGSSVVGTAVTPTGTEVFQMV
jgi:lysophospholipase L1-like esterase